MLRTHDICIGGRSVSPLDRDSRIGRDKTIQRRKCTIINKYVLFKSKKNIKTHTNKNLTGEAIKYGGQRVSKCRHGCNRSL